MSQYPFMDEVQEQLKELTYQFRLFRLCTQAN
uniref:Uncharacterized protein n=1 Tax=viral metagenome TaxID=1070528 RepID=A0A6C0BLI4_9ZZZZ